MIRVDYQKKSQLSDLQEPMPPDRGSTSPVSSIQGEFYSYLGISSKEDESTSPSKSALDDFDLSKRRSLRVRVVNKLKEHQAKMMKIAERTNAGGESPAKEAMRDEQEEEEDEGVCTPEREMHSSLSRMSRLDSQCSSRNGTAGDPSPNTILARRCYFNIKSSDASPSPTPSTIHSPAFTPSPLFVSALNSTCSVSLSRVANMGREFEDHFSDFEEEIKKHVNLPEKERRQEREEQEEVVSAIESPSTTTSPSQTVVHREKRGEKNNKKGQKNKKSKRTGKLIAQQRIIIRRSRKGFPQATPKWTTMDAVNNHNNNGIKMPSCSINLSRFKQPVELPIHRIPAHPPPPPTNPEFTLLQKLEDVAPYTVLDTHVKREATPGPILGTYYDERERILLVVTEKKVAFFQHHANVAMFQKVVPTAPRNTKNGGLQHSVKPRCAWSQIDSVDRMTRDEQVTELLFEKRIMAGDGGKTSASFVYVELRGQPLKKDRDYRTGEMCATYVNLYYLSRGGSEECDLAIEAKTVALDTIVALPEDISYAILPQERTLVMCWTERDATKGCVGICKYTLSVDLATMAQAEEFQGVDGELSGLREDGESYVIGTGNNQISIWDSRSGRLLSNIVLTDFELGDTIFATVMNVDRHERHLLLVQYWQNYLNVVHVNLLDYAYRVLKSRELSCTKEAVQSVERVDAGDGANVILGLVARRGGGAMGEAPHELLQLFDALTNRLVVMQRNCGGVADVLGAGDSGITRLFLNKKYLIKVGDRLQPETISIQPANEFLFNLI